MAEDMSIQEAKNQLSAVTNIFRAAARVSEVVDNVITYEQQANELKASIERLTAERESLAEEVKGARDAHEAAQERRERDAQEQVKRSHQEASDIVRQARETAAGDKEAVDRANESTRQKTEATRAELADLIRQRKDEEFELDKTRAAVAEAKQSLQRIINA